MYWHIANLGPPHCLSPALVRTLADVFTDQTWLVQHYAAYVLHLEQALQDVKDVLDVVQPLLIGRAKKLNDKDVLREQKRLARAIMVRRTHLRTW
jgi:hypothetical protein